MARRRTAWQAYRMDDRSVAIDGDSNTTIISKATFHEWSPEPTIVRIVGTVYLSIGTASEATSVLNVWWGIYCASENDAGTAVSQQELAEVPWLYTGYLRNFHWGVEMPYWDGDSAESQAAAFPPFNDVNWERFNTRVMRKVPQDCLLRLVTTSVSSGVAPSSAALHGYFRILMKEN